MRAKVVLVCLTALAFHTVLSQVSNFERIDCHPEPNATVEGCEARGCIWAPIDEEVRSGIPWCHTKLDYGYGMVGSPIELPAGYRVSLRRLSVNSSYFGNDFDDLTVDISFESDYRLRIKIFPTGVERFEVPIQINPPSSPARSPLYRVDFVNSPVFSFKVIRVKTGVPIFDTSLGGLTFSDQFIQISTRLPSGSSTYGIGENEQFTFKHDFSKYSSLPLWARDQSPEGNVNLYGVHPYYTVVENTLGDTHSVAVVNANAQEFVRIPVPAFVYRTIGGLLDFYIFLGPTPEHTATQYSEAFGRSPIPPYWGLGFQLCKWGYNTLDNMKAAVDRTAQYGIPHDVQYGDIDIMERSLDFTISSTNFAGLPEYVQELKAKGIKFITILDPGISFKEPPGTYRPFDLGDEMDVWLKRPDGTPMVGIVWPGGVYFPDYSKNATREWWITLIMEFKSLLDFDGLWIDMNEPASWGDGDTDQGCAINNINYPPYVPTFLKTGKYGDSIADSTICLDVQHEFGQHYDTHSLYGWSESEPTLAGVRQALGKRGVVLTRSSFLGVGQWASHWLGDNYSQWSNLHMSIIGMLQFNHFAVPYVGADICGFNGAATSQMCQRWLQLGAFYTFARSHNGLGNPDQDPGFLGPEVAESTRKALLVRYTLLPYLYTLFYFHTTRGSTVVRALWHEFPQDQTALEIDRQFLWGKGVLISAVLEENQTSVNAYFPDARWYDYYDGSEVSAKGEFLTLDAPLDHIHVHLRGGVVYPTQEPAINTEISRNNSFGLIVALDEFGFADGRLYVDDGDSIDPELSGNFFELIYFAGSNAVTASVVHNGYSVSGKILDTVRLLGAGRPVTGVTLNGVPHPYFTNEPSGEVKINQVNASLNFPIFRLEWSN